MNWWQYVNRITGGAAQTDIAKRVGLSGPSVSRWKESAPKPENVAAFARAYKRPVLEAFVAAGFLTNKEAGERPTGRASLGELSNDELVTEIGRRLLHTNDYELAAHKGSTEVGPEDLPHDT